MKLSSVRPSVRLSVRSFVPSLIACQNNISFHIVSASIVECYS